MEFVFLWLLMGGIGAAIGQKKGRPAEGFFAGLLLGPLGIIFILVRQPKWKCPDCGGAIDKGVKKCKHCGSVLVPDNIEAQK